MHAALGIFGVVLSTLVVPLPEELALLGAGWVAHSGATPLWAAWVASWLAIVGGDTTSYFIGRSFLPRLLQTRFGKRIISPEMQAWGNELVQRHGFRVIILGRFLVALRGPVYLAIGAAKYSLLKFELINSAVGLVEVGLLVYLGYRLGQSSRVAHEAKWVEIGIAVLLGLALIAAPLFKRHLQKKRAKPPDPRR